MTFHSGRIEVLPGGAGLELEPERRDLPLLTKLPEHCNWVHELETWAKAKGKRIHYADNCWFRVAMSADELGGFIKAGRRTGEPWVTELLGLIRHGDAYIVEAESF